MLKDGGFRSHTMTEDHEKVVVDMISRSFADRGDLTTLAHVSYDNLFEQVEILWSALLAAGLSLVVTDDADRIVGACLNFDARSEEAQPLCACAAFARNMAENQDDDEEEQENGNATENGKKTADSKKDEKVSFATLRLH
jgi:hypothetical protein